MLFITAFTAADVLASAFFASLMYYLVKSFNFVDSRYQLSNSVSAACRMALAAASFALLTYLSAASTFELFVASLANLNALSVSSIAPVAPKTKLVMYYSVLSKVLILDHLSYPS